MGTVGSFGVVFRIRADSVDLEYNRSNTEEEEEEDDEVFDDNDDGLVMVDLVERCLICARLRLVEERLSVGRLCSCSFRLERRNEEEL